MINNLVGLKVEHIAGILNVFHIHIILNKNFLLKIISGIPLDEIMEQISTKSRTALGPLLRVVGWTRSRTLSTKTIGTLR